MRTYIGGALVLLALAAAGVALFLTLSLKQDAATKDDLNAMRDQLSSVEQFAATAAHKGVRSLDQRLDRTRDEVDKLSTGSDDVQARAEGDSGRHQGAPQPGVRRHRIVWDGRGRRLSGAGAGTGAGTGLGGTGTGAGTGGGSTGAGAGGTGQ